MHTKPLLHVIDILVKAGLFKTDDLAKRPGLEKFDTDETLAEKLGIPITVFVKI